MLDHVNLTDVFSQMYSTPSWFVVFSKYLQTRAKMFDWCQQLQCLPKDVVAVIVGYYVDLCNLRARTIQLWYAQKKKWVCTDCSRARARHRLTYSTVHNDFLGTASKLVCSDSCLFRCERGHTYNDICSCTQWIPHEDREWFDQGLGIDRFLSGVPGSRELSCPECGSVVRVNRDVMFEITQYYNGVYFLC